MCKKLDQITRSFWWGHDTGDKKLHLKSSNSICQAKSDEGVGIRNMKTMNRAMLGKQAWKMITKPSSILATTLLPKFYNKETFVKVKPKECDSWIWKSLLPGRDVYLKKSDT